MMTKRRILFCVVLALSPGAAWAGPTMYAYELYGTDAPDLYSFSGPPALNNAGEVAFTCWRTVTQAQVVRGNGGPLTRMDSSVYPASSVDYPSQYPAINDLGVVSYERRVVNVAYGYRSDGTTIVEMFPSPLNTPIGTAINNSGAVATYSWDSSDDWKSGIFVTSDGSAITTVAKQGTAVPGGGAFTGFAYGADINNSGTVAFLGTAGTVSGVYAWSAGNLTRVIDSTSGVKPGLYAPRINDSGLVAFSGKNAANQSAIFTSAGNDVAQEVVNLPAAGLAGMHADSLALNNNGLLAYWAYTASAAGIYTAGTASGAVVVAGGALDGKTVANLSFGAEGLNDYGQIAFTVKFTSSADWFVYMVSPFPCARPMGLSRGAGEAAYAPDGFAEGGYTTAGLGGATPLSGTVAIEGLTLDDGLATVIGAYDPSEIAALGLDEGTIRLYWDDAGTWALAGRASNLDQATGQFVPGAPTDVLGDWGVDTEGHYAWANVDHASTFAMAGVPEPATVALLSLGGLALLRRGKGPGRPCRRHP